jgi:chromatin remodeling complex protein RSC6
MKSGFVLPTMISNELADFLLIPRGSMIPRTEVTRLVTEYVKANNLGDSKKSKVIQADGRMKSLLKHGDNELTWFNLQRYLSPHYNRDFIQRNDMRARI